MTVTQRTGEADTSTGRFDNLRQVLVFPWRADHSEHPGCSFHGVFYTEQAAQHALATHECPTPFTGWGYKFMGIAEMLWVELDRVTDQIIEWKDVDPSMNAAVAKSQGRATGLAFALVKICHPYYDDEKAVSKEALARWKMRNGQMDYRHTPGFKYDPPIPGTPRYKTEHLGSPDGVTPATYTSDHNAESAPAPVSGRRRRAAAKPVKVLTPLEVETIRKAGTAFPVKDLASMYGVTEDAIRAAQA